MDAQKGRHALTGRREERGTGESDLDKTSKKSPPTRHALTGRREEILMAIIDRYIRTGEPVGSKAIASLPTIDVSAATVRGDMALLEQLGFLEQPHTSSGRVPTYQAYRYYIEMLGSAHLSEKERERLDTMLGDESTWSEELILQNASTALAQITQCATVVSSPPPKYSVITKVDVIETGKRLYAVLLITSDGKIKNRACRLQFDLSDEDMTYLRGFLADCLVGVSLDELSTEKIDAMATTLGTYMMTLTPLVQSIYALSQEMQQGEVFVSGEENLLEYNDLDKAEVAQFVMHKNALTQLLDDSFSGIRVLFGDTDGDFVIGNSSMIVSPIQKGEKAAGVLGVIGPVRLDYAKILPYIAYFSEKISRLISGEPLKDSPRALPNSPDNLNNSDKNDNDKAQRVP